jgi:hypothetical protein
MALNVPRVRLLIADDVGLGKTVEAGLVVTELLSRQMARNVLVVCPANLREQWREALEYFFHLDAKVVSSRHRRALERNLPAGANPWEFYRPGYVGGFRMPRKPEHAGYDEVRSPVPAAVSGEPPSR